MPIVVIGPFRNQVFTSAAAHFFSFEGNTGTSHVHLCFRKHHESWNPSQITSSRAVEGAQTHPGAPPTLAYLPQASDPSREPTITITTARVVKVRV